MRILRDTERFTSFWPSIVITKGKPFREELSTA